MFDSETSSLAVSVERGLTDPDTNMEQGLGAVL